MPQGERGAVLFVPVMGQLGPPAKHLVSLCLWSLRGRSLKPPGFPVVHCLAVRAASRCPCLSSA